MVTGIAIALASILTSAAEAQPIWGPTSIYTIPSQPYSGSGFQVNFTGDAKVGCAPLVVDGASAAVSGSIIQVTVFISCGIAPLLPATYAGSVSIAPLTAGSYSIQHIRQTRPLGPPPLPYGAPELAATLPITVLAGPAPPIPTLSGIGFATLVLWTLVAGLWRMHARSASSTLVGFLFFTGIVATIGCLGWPTCAQAETSRELATRQIIVLFDPRHDPPTSTAIVDGIAASERNAFLDALLRHPDSAHSLLSEVATDESRAQLARSPFAPRALLEQYVVLTYADEATARGAMAALAAEPAILSVEQNRPLRFSAIPNDCYFNDPHAPPCQSTPSDPRNYQWGMQLLRFPSAWDRVRGQSYIAAIDSGIEWVVESGSLATHPDLRKNFRPLFSKSVIAGQPPSDIDDHDFNDGLSRGHGTHVSGIMAATPEYGAWTSVTNTNSNSGVSGGCWGCSTAMFKFDETFGNAASALTSAIDRGFTAVNISFGDGASAVEYQYTSCSQSFYQAFCTAMAYASARDVTLVASSGNQGVNRVQFPARDPGVISVGGVEANSSFWTSHAGYLEAGSNYGPEQSVVAPARDVLSTFYRNYDWNADVPCGDSVGPPTGSSLGYGDCTGTSMAAPFITALVGLIRSANPLLDRSVVKNIITGNSQPCTGGDGRCGAGFPDAGKAVTAALGSPAVVNRLTPLFSQWSATAKDHFYTSVPQMALAAITSGGLLPQPVGGAISYSQIGLSIPGYPTLPHSFSPGPPAAAIASVFTTHRSPLLRGLELAPIYRLSRRCGDEPPGTIPACTSGDPHYNPSHVTHFYTSDPEGVKQMTGYDINGLKLTGYPAGWGYRMDGIEGYVYPVTQAQGPGTVKLCRKYDVDRDDWILFPGAGSGGTDCSATTDGYAGGNYSGSITGYDWIGWAYPVQAPKAVYATAYLPVLSLLLDD